MTGVGTGIATNREITAASASLERMAAWLLSDHPDAGQTEPGAPTRSKEAS